MTHENRTDVSAYPWTHWEKITFNQSFVSKHQMFSLMFSGGKRRSKVVGTFKNFWDWGTETFNDQSKTQLSSDMAVIDTIQ